MTTNITAGTMIDLLSLMAVYDQRTVGMEEVKGWLVIADLEDWDAAAVQRVIVEHYRRDADKPRLSPPAVSDRLRSIRRAFAETFPGPVIPEDLPARDYPAWYRQLRDAHVDRGLAAWAATGEEPRRGAIDGNVHGSLASLVQQAPDHVRDSLRASVERIEDRRP